MRSTTNLTAGSLATMTMGILLNLSTLAANGWRFPEWAPGDYPGYIGADVARLTWLGDWIHVEPYWLSPGDLLIFSGPVVALAVLLVHGWRTGRWLQPIEQPPR